MAGRRNATPEALPLPRVGPTRDARYLVHTVDFDERRDFQPGPTQPLQVLPLTAPLAFVALSIVPFGTGVEVRVSGTDSSSRQFAVPRSLKWPAHPPGNRLDGWSDEVPKLQPAAAPPVGELPIALTSLLHQQLPECFQVGEGEWGQVTYNRRLSFETSWAYLKWVFNIAVTRVPEGNLFTARPPVSRASRLHHLQEGLRFERSIPVHRQAIE
jgi:hypothetical protein